MPCLVAVLALALSAQPAPTVQDRIVREAERHLGKPYVFGGRDGRPGCVGRKRCAEGIDCLSLLFFAFEEVAGKSWTRFAVKPSETVRRKELGEPVQGLAGVLAAELDRTLLRKGDVLLFLLDGYNLEADAPLLVRGETKYGVWHTGLVHGVSAAGVEVIHAKPGDRVVVEPLEAISFDGVFALRLPEARPCPRRCFDLCCGPGEVCAHGAGPGGHKCVRPR